MTVAACIVISLWIIVCLLFGMVLVYWVGYSHGMKRKHEKGDNKKEITTSKVDEDVDDLK